MALSDYRENDAKVRPAMFGPTWFIESPWPGFLIPIVELCIGALLVVSVVLLADGIYSWTLATTLLSALVLIRLYGRSEGSSVFGSSWFSVFAAALISLIILNKSPQIEALIILLAIVAGAEFLRLAVRDQKERAETKKLTALLLFEGRLGSKSYYDERINFCRALLALSHRTNCPLSVLALSWETPSALVKSFEKSALPNLGGIDKYLQRFELIRTIENAVRASDMVLVDQDENLVLVVCPNTPASGANCLARRLSVRVQKDANFVLIHSVASYADDGYSIEEIISESIKRIKNTTTDGWTLASHRQLPTTIVMNNTRPASTSTTRSGDEHSVPKAEETVDGPTL